MISGILRWGSVRLPEKQRVIRSFGRLPQLVQSRGGAAALLSAAAIASLALVVCLTLYVRSLRLAGDEHAAALHAESANAELQAELARLRDQLGAANRDLAATQGRIAALADEARRRAGDEANKGDRLGQLNRALEQAQRELHVTEAQRVTLMARLNKAEAELAEEQARKAQAQAVLDQSQRRLQQLQSERDKTASERDELRARLNRLEQKGSMLRTPPVPEAKPAAVAAAAAPQAARPAAPVPAQAAEPAAAAPARAPGAVARGGGMSEVERVLASAGVDVARLFQQFGVTRGEGGPFVPAPKGRVPETALTPEKLAALRAMIKTLPVSAPLASYEIGSPFGVRYDPINGRSSFHTGLDFDAPYESPVYATAAGTVTYAGYRDDYGKIVEIDHGNGISTRYAHLHRFTVSVGEHVGAHTQIGYLGSTGRATGPHVHYEVLVNGEPQDPEKFLHLGHVVPVAAQR